MVRETIMDARKAIIVTAIREMIMAEKVICIREMIRTAIRNR